MKSIYLCIMAFLLFAIPLMAGEAEDLLFAIGVYEDGDYSLARQQLQQFLTEYPQSEYYQEMQCLLADVLLNLKEYAAAADLYEQLKDEPAVYSQYSNILYGLGQTRYYLQEYSAAKGIFEELISRFPDHEQKSRFYYFLGSSEYELSSYEAAKKHLERSLASARQMSTILKLIQVNLVLGDQQEAQKLLIEALREFSGNNDLHYALLLVQADNIQRGNYQEVLSIGSGEIPPSSRYYQQYSILTGIASFELGNYQKAAEILKSIEDEKARYYFALSQIELQETDEAKEILAGLQKASDPQIRANSVFYLADLSDDSVRKEELLAGFIRQYPGNIFIAEAYYKLGLVFFEKESYRQAVENLQKALAEMLAEPYRQKAVFLRAEAQYLSGNLAAAENGFNEYIAEYPDGEYADDAYFKKGLCLYHSDRKNDADEQFKLVIYNYPNSARLGMSYFYRAEIALLSKRYSDARKFYSIAINQKVDNDLVWLRIAQSWQQESQYDKAAAALENVDDSSVYKIDKFVLLGDISFAKKDYQQAKQYFLQASEMEKVPEKLESIQAKLAWTFYQTGDYERASQIYSQLSIKTDDPAAYTFQSATAMFSARQFETALRQYQLFVKNFPESSNALAAEVGIGDCYYNLGNYDAARKQYRKLLTKVINPELYNSILDGWKWSTEQSGQDFMAEIEDFINSDIPENVQFLVLSYQARYLFNQQEYTEVNELVNYLKANFAYPMKEAEYLKAHSLKELGRWKEADDFYARLFTVYKDAALQLKWADVVLEMGKTDMAIRKLQYAAQKLQTPEAILKLLRLEVELDHADFEEDYYTNITLLSGIDKEEAQLEKVRWLLNKKNFAEAEPMISMLKNSTNNTVKAEAQYLSGYRYYQSGAYQQAVPELLRVRHLFPHLENVRHRCEILAFKAYLKTGKTNEAKNLLENIKDELDSTSLSELDALLKESE